MASSADSASRSACAPAADFVLPNVSDPAQYVNARYHGYQGDSTGETALQFSKGTTTLGFKFQGGVIVSVDSRSTQGSYIGAWPPWGGAL
jgi:20S proteasome subunit beta 5